MQKRHKLLVHDQIQKTLIKRALLYSSACVLFMVLPATLVSAFRNPERLLPLHFVDVLIAYWPVLASAVVLGPIAAYDMLRLSNRFVGPVVRITNELKRVAAGENVEPIVFREGDYWHEVAIAFNDLHCDATREPTEGLSTDDHHTNDVF